MGPAGIARTVLKRVTLDAMDGSSGESLFLQRYRAFIKFANGMSCMLTPEHQTVVAAGPASLVSTMASFPVRIGTLTSVR